MFSFMLYPERWSWFWWKIPIRRLEFRDVGVADL
jgi:hypothetical protein